MTNSYDVDHGLSQDAPGPLGLEAPDDILARTGNTARDQEMYAAGLEKGEENAKHNAAIRGAWLPIESAPKDGRRVLLWNERYTAAITGQFYGLGGWKLDGEMPPLFHQPTHWMSLPPAPGAPASPSLSSLHGFAPGACDGMKSEDYVNKVRNDDCSFPDCAAPASPASTVEQGDAVKRLRDAIEGECSGVWISEKQAIAVLAHLNLPAPAAGDALAVGALAELVACDRLKKQIASMQACVLETEDDVQELDAMMTDLARRQPAAWDAARAVLAAQRKGDA